tara:strand:+ start:11790 stop:11954 length:165 start_codon:yes stop_codon:yes gene_type:complete
MSNTEQATLTSTEELNEAMKSLNEQSRQNIQMIREKHGAAAALNAIADGFGISK